MIDIEEEKYVNISPSPVSYKGTEKILEQMNNCVCRIYNNGEGTGFFTKIPFKSKFLPVLITNNHVINELDINNNKVIILYLNNDKIEKSLKLDNKRLKYTNKTLDITIIEIKEDIDKLNNKYLELDDSIINYFKSNKNENANYLNNKYTNISIYAINYPEDKDVVVSYSQPPKLNNSEISHKCCTKPGSSGSPILLITNQKLIGIHCGCFKNFQINKGSLLINALIEIQKKEYNSSIIDNKGTYINNNNEKRINNNLIGNVHIKEENQNIKINNSYEHYFKDSQYNKNIKNMEKEINNYIIAEFDIKEENQKIRIINSFEEYCRENNFNKNVEKLKNEKEIKDNCEIRINGKKITFSYFYKFDNKGIYNIRYIFKKDMKKLDYMFYNCTSLTKIDLSNFNSYDATNLSSMFYNCLSLKDINLSNFSTYNVTDMSGMFYGCESLLKLNLINFNTNKVTDMFQMFAGCLSLKSLNLTNFNINNNTDISAIFFRCPNLTENNIIVSDKKLLEEATNLILN